MLVALLGVCVGVLAVGCDGKGIDIPTATKTSDGDDNSGDDDTPDPTDDTENLGSWVSAFADDTVQDDAEGGLFHYAAALSLRRDGSALTATGTVYRLYASGAKAYDKLTVTLTGSISGDDATLTAQSATGATVYDSPTWRLRFAGTKMVGTYFSKDFNHNVVRSGRAVWYKTDSSDAATSLDRDWVAGFNDDSGTLTWPARDRTGLLAMLYDSESRDLSGTGHFVEQRDGDAVQELDFALSDATISMPRVGFTAGALDMANSPMDWIAYYAAGTLVGAYSQFDADNRVARCGRATWHQAITSPEPADAEGLWVASFSDSDASASRTRSDYLVALNLTTATGDVVTGSGRLLDEGGETQDYQTLTVSNGQVVGGHVTFEFRSSTTQNRYAWDLRVTPTMLVGSYQRFDSYDRYVSRGNAEWRRQRSTISLTGTWAASFVDTLNLRSSVATQLVLVNVASQADGGALTGNGALRYANGETTRRLFRLADSTVNTTNDDIVWRWRGSDLFGDTVWHLRQGTDALYGTYTNYTSAGAVEAQGSAVWIRTSTTSSF